MRKFVVNKRTGFTNVKPQAPVVIRDFRFMMFYTTEGMNEVSEFNLPKGTYYLDRGHIRQKPDPVKYKLSRLPSPERNRKYPTNYKILWAENPNKCTIKWLKKQIVFDNGLKDSSLPELFFILFHEYGHAKYKTEKYADLFAANMMKKRGFNPSQIGKAPITSLSAKQYHRKRHIVDNIINTSK